MQGITMATGHDNGRTGRAKTIATIIAATLILAGCSGGKVQGGAGDHVVPKDPGPPQKIHLVWKAQTNSWKVKQNGDPNEQDPDKAITHIPNGTGPTMFEVDIQGASQNVSFKDPGGLSVWTGSKSAPPPQSGINSTQIVGPVIDNHGHLIFYDLNTEAGDLNYSLEFNGGAPPVDPIVDNGGGGYK